MSRNRWEQMFPRIIGVFLAIGIFSFVLFDVIARDSQMTLLHFWLLIAACILVLATIASRLRAFNVVDFDSRLQALQETTARELANIRQQLSATFEQRIMPSQNVTTHLSLNLGSIMQTLGKTPSLDQEYRGREYNREIFLRRADAYRLYAGTLLQIARMFQIAVVEHRFPEPSTPEGDENENDRDTTFEDSLDDRILRWSQAVLKHGVHALFPFRLVNSDREEIEKLVRGVESCLHLLPSFIEIRNKVDTGKIATPSYEQAEELFDKLADGLGDLRVAILITGSQSIISLNEIQTAISEFRAKIRSEIESLESQKGHQ